MKKTTETNLIFRSWVVAALLPCLSGCGGLTTYQNGGVRESAAVDGAVAGLIGGAALGSAFKMNGPAPILVGGVVGGVIGKSMKEAWGARERLRRAGVQVEQQGEEVTVYIPTDICFAPNEDVLLESCYPILDQVVVLLKTFKCDVPMSCAGHTDDIGSSAHKQRLADHEASAIASYLWTHGISDQQLKIVAHGDCDSVATNRNSCGSKANRRVQINIRPNLAP